MCMQDVANNFSAWALFSARAGRLFSASSYSMARAPASTLSSVCVSHLPPVAHIVAIESRGNWLKTRGTDPQPQQPVQGIQKPLK